MWRCIRCEKENQDAVEICVECGHARTMDYMYHRTLSRIPETVAANWKIVHDTSREYAQENRKAATEFIERKQGDLEYSRTCWQRKIADTQNEINRLRGVAEECDRKIEKIARANARRGKIEKIARAGARRGKIALVVAFLLLLVSIILAYPDVKNWLSYINFNAVLTALGGMSFLCVVFAIFYGVLLFEINSLTDDRNKTLKQITTERDSTQEAIDTWESMLTDINQYEDLLREIREDRENLINHLAQVSPQEMEAEFEKLIG